MKASSLIAGGLLALVLMFSGCGSSSGSNSADTANVPVLADSNTAVVENAAAGTSVGMITVVSSGAGDITAITLSGTGSSNFSVATDGTVTLNAESALDYETAPEYNLSAVATNTYGHSHTANVHITVLDYANYPFQTAKVQAGDPHGEDKFGRSVAISGDYMVVGSEGDDTTATDAGSAYVYKRQFDGSFIQIAKIQADDAQAGDRFGYSVAISGDYIVVGAFEKGTGRAYLFKRNSDNNVTQIAKIQASDAAESKYGYSVAISGDYIVVGAFAKGTPAIGAGGVYVYKRNSDTLNDVTEIANIQASDASEYYYFGYSVAISGDYIVVGSVGDDTNAGDAGSAYLFKRNSDSNVTQIAKVQAGDPQGLANFGKSVGISGDYIVVGADWQDTTAPNSGSAYLFKRNSDSNLTQTAKIQAGDATSSVIFGRSVAISGDYIAVGAPAEDTTAYTAGSAYVFKKDIDGNVTQIAKVQARDAEANDWFGISVAISGNYIAVGAHQEDTTATDAGSAYVFDLEPVERPYIYNRPFAPIRYDENSYNNTVISFQAVSPSGGPVTYSLDGTDAGSLQLVNNVLSYFANPDFELPIDSDGLNDYNITVTATDINNHETTIDVNILVKDQAIFDLAKVQAGDAQTSDLFGSSVAISGAYIVAGAPYEDTTALDAGSAYVYKRNSDAPGDVTQIAKIQADDAEAGDQFGISVAISGDYIVVGAMYEDTTATNAGSVYVFKRNSDTPGDVTQIAKIQAGDAEASDWFGSSVAISGDYIVVGAYSEDTTANNAGSVYLFKRNSDSNVTQIAKIQAGDAEVADKFGFSVAISGDYIAVGAPQDDTTTMDTGSAYVFKRNSDTLNDVTQIAKVQADDGQSGDQLGYSVAISGDYIVTGTPYGDTTATADTGTAYLFKRNSDTLNDVTQIAKIQADDAEAGDLFGASVSISGDFIVIGALQEDTTAADTGSAYVFKRNSDTLNDVTQRIKIQASDAQVDDWFGYSVAISGEYMVVGALQKDIVAATNGGSAYVYLKDYNQLP